MFTGIIQSVGSVVAVDDGGSDRRITIDPGGLVTDDLSPGDSICINGVCLTITRIAANGFELDVSGETLACTTLGGLAAGSNVNLEKSLKLGDFLGGHLVSGHVDGIGLVVSLADDGRSVRCHIEAGPGLEPYLCKKGSICVDGVSLTINEVSHSRFSINVIPHTLEHTIFRSYRPDTRVNLEVDIVARYLEKLAPPRH